MGWTRLLKNIIKLLILSGLLYFEFSYWHHTGVSLGLLLLYLILLGNCLLPLLTNFFQVSAALRIRLLAFFLGLAVFGWSGGLFLVFFGFNAKTVLGALLLAGLVSVLARYRAGEAKVAPVEMENTDWQVLEEMPSPVLSTVIYLLAVGLSLYWLYQSHTDAVVSSPWQVIDKDYVWAFLLTTFTIGLLIFSRLHAKTILFLLSIHAFLLYSFLPLTHQLIYGSDQWRHIAVEQRLANGLGLGAPAVTDQVESWLDIGRLAYADFWFDGALARKFLSVDLIVWNKWLLPVAAALFLPILLFEIGRALGWEKKKSLCLVWLSFWPFALQMVGAFSLPVSWGFLTWLFLFWLLLKWSQQPNKRTTGVLLALGSLSLFGYTLYFVIFWLAWLVLWLVTRREHRTHWINSVFYLVLFLVVALSLPALELLFSYSSVGLIDWLIAAKQFVGNFSTFYLASGPRPHDILAGNIFFNQTPAYAFVANFLTQWRWWLTVLMTGWWVLWLSGSARSFYGRDARIKFLALFSSGLLLSYVISRYFLSGEHVLTRRLEPVLALVILLVVFSVLAHFLPANLTSWAGRWRVLGVLILGAVMIATSYSLGPDTRAASVDEWSAMNYLWEQEGGAGPYCVLADTQSLLILEAVSVREIVGGGFPINKYFAQPERERLLAIAKEYPDLAIREAAVLTQADHCWLAKPTSGVSPALPLVASFGNILLYNYQP